MKIFVYGTLKKGFPLYLGEHVRSIHKATIKGRMYASLPDRMYPFVDIHKEGVVHGEVHDVNPDIIDVLDYIERRYYRVKVRTLEGELVSVYHHNVDESAPYYELIPSGIWEN